MKSNPISHFCLTILFAGALSGSVSSTVAAEDLWVTDFAKAKETAAKEKKDLLMDFTGSDWCGWCIQLRKEVFDKAAFKKEAPKSFVLMEVDFPQNKPLPEKLQEQNEKLSEEFHIEGYPTIILADAVGRPYAKTGYQEGGEAEYLKHLAELRGVREKRDAAFAAAEKAEGLDKAKHLAEGLKALDSDLVEAHYGSVVEQIITLDKEDTLGMKKEHEFNKAAKSLQSTLETLHGEGKMEEFTKAIDSFISEHKLEGEQKQKTMMMKMAAFDETKLDQAQKLAEDVIKVDEKTKTADAARDLLEQINDIRESQKKEGKGDKKNQEDKEAPAEKDAPKPEKSEKEEK